MTALFVTATGTDIGKTFVTTGLIRALRAKGRIVDALKPVVSGFDPADVAPTDTGAILEALGKGLSPETIAEISPWRFAAPLSPDMAARREGRRIDFEALLAFCRMSAASALGTLLIEGVGGIMVPLDDRHTVLDWMAALNLPVLLVAGSYLGTISHTLSALDVLARRGLSVLSVVVSESVGSPVDLAETAETIRRFGNAVDVVNLPRPTAAAHPVFTALAERL
jgi:dethiobiotin synthetase